MQETWLRPHLDFILHGYVAVCMNRESGTRGGVAMFIQQGIGYRIIKISKDSEAIVVEVWMRKTTIWIVNYYNPCGKLSKEALEKITGEETNQTVTFKVVPWWSDEFNKAINARNKAFRKVKGSFSFNDLIEYKKTQAEVRRMIRNAKRNYWKQFCNNIGRETHINQVWGMIRRTGVIRREYTLPLNIITKL